MNTIRQLLEKKGRRVISARLGDTVYQALALMAQHDIGALLVMEGDRLVGIFSERDYARKTILYGKTSAETRLSEIMTGKVFHVAIEQTLEECMSLMAEKHIRHLPVLEGGQVVGVISASDLIRASLSHEDYLQHQFS
jgi:CBS domain-containing protein